MSESEVHSILGEPTKKEEVGNGDFSMLVWRYHGPNDNISIVFDGEQGVMAAGLNGIETVVQQ